MIMIVMVHPLIMIVMVHPLMLTLTLTLTSTLISTLTVVRGSLFKDKFKPFSFEAGVGAVIKAREG